MKMVEGQPGSVFWLSKLKMACLLVSCVHAAHPISYFFLSFHLSRFHFPVAGERLEN